MILDHVKRGHMLPGALTTMTQTNSSVPASSGPQYNGKALNRRCRRDRRKRMIMWPETERRLGQNRRQDADWRFALIRRTNREDRHKITLNIAVGVTDRPHPPGFRSPLPLGVEPV